MGWIVAREEDMSATQNMALGENKWEKIRGGTQRHAWAP
jgi:hypothetical protein